MSNGVFDITAHQREWIRRLEQQVGFDITAHQRERIRRLEQQVAGLEQTRDQLVRVLADVLDNQFRDTHVDQLEYLNAVVDCDRMRQELGL